MRFWSLKRALEYALSLWRLPGRLWEVILGHCTFLGLQERQLEHVLHHLLVHPAKLLHQRASVEQRT